MKTLAIGCGVCLIASSVSAALTKDDVRRLNESTRVISELRNAPDNGIPKDLWNRAQCVLVVPSLARFTFLVVEYGSGVMSCRRSNGWSHPVFVRLANRSWGLQLGPQQVDLVLLVMNRSGAHALLQGKVSLGVDVSIAAGPGDGASNAAMDARMNAQMLSYSRSHGVFAGIDLSGGVLQPDHEADARAYGASVTARDIIDGTTEAATPAAASAFVTALAAAPHSSLSPLRHDRPRP